MSKNNNMKVYKLAGASLKAARIIFDASRTEIKDKADIIPFRDKYKTQLRAIGAGSRSVQVKIQDGALPRAYMHIPTCYLSPSQNFAVYMFAPVDYKGRHFEPKGATLLNEKEAASISEGLWAGGWTTPEPLLPVPRLRGTELPADFNKAADRFIGTDAPFDYAAAERFKQGIERMKPHFCDAVISRWWDNDPANIALNTRLVPDADGRAQMVLSAKDLSTGESLKLKSSAWVTVEPLADDEYLMKPIAKCAGGMVLRDALNEIQPLPDKEQLWINANADDQSLMIVPPPLPRELLHLDRKAPWPFPKSTPAP